MTNGQRSTEGVYFQGDEYDYMHNHTLTSHHLMPLEDEDNDGAIFMLQGAQRSELYYCEGKFTMNENCYHDKMKIKAKMSLFGCFCKC